MVFETLEVSEIAQEIAETKKRQGLECKLSDEHWEEGEKPAKKVEELEPKAGGKCGIRRPREEHVLFMLQTLAKENTHSLSLHAIYAARLMLT